MGEIITIDRHILETEKKFPHATGKFTGLLQHLALVAKIVSIQVRRAGLVDVIGSTGTTNVQGEEVQKLDEIAHRTLVDLMIESGYVAVMASEEDEHFIRVPREPRRGTYVVNFDPLDGSSNISTNASIGTIFSILPRVSDPKNQPTIDDCRQPGRNQLAAGYILYGSSTLFVYTTGAGVHGFTYDPMIGEFLLSHPDIRIPNKCTYFSSNLGYINSFSKGLKSYIEDVNQTHLDDERPTSHRYIGSLVADFHRNLITGGIYLYPAKKAKNGTLKPKLRLLYEANPLAFIAEQAGGKATNGRMDIMDVIPTELHERCELFIGNKKEVEILEQFIQKED